MKARSREGPTGTLSLYFDTKDSSLFEVFTPLPGRLASCATRPRRGTGSRRKLVSTSCGDRRDAPSSPLAIPPTGTASTAGRRIWVKGTPRARLASGAAPSSARRAPCSPTVKSTVAFDGRSWGRRVACQSRRRSAQEGHRTPTAIRGLRRMVRATAEVASACETLTPGRGKLFSGLGGGRYGREGVARAERFAPSGTHPLVGHS